MPELEILNKKKTKQILKEIKQQWGCTLSSDYVFLKSPKGKLYLASPELRKIDTSWLNIDSVGLYFASTKAEALRLTIEGTQLIGPKARKNVVELDKKEAEEWLRGEDLEKQTACTGFVIIRHRDDYMGCGKVAEKKILNFCPKIRRISKY